MPEAPRNEQGPVNPTSVIAALGELTWAVAGMVGQDVRRLARFVCGKRSKAPADPTYDPIRDDAQWREIH